MDVLGVLGRRDPSSSRCCKGKARLRLGHVLAVCEERPFFFPEAETLEGESVHSALTFKLQCHTLEDSHQRIKVWNRTLPSRNVGDYIGEDYAGY